MFDYTASAILQQQKKEMRTGRRREEEMTEMIEIKDGGREEASEEPDTRTEKVER